jgi:hypothetical protein
MLAGKLDPARVLQVNCMVCGAGCLGPRFAVQCREGFVAWGYLAISPLNCHITTINPNSSACSPQLVIERRACFPYKIDQLSAARGTASFAHRFAPHAMNPNNSAARHLTKAAHRKNMQIISTFQAKAALPLRAAKNGTRIIQSAPKPQTLQPSGLTREEVRQIVIDMIG